MKPLWTWSGKYFGYLDGDDLWTCGGKHVGRLQDDGIYGPDGRYLGEIESDDRLITCKSKKASRGNPYGTYANSVGMVNYVDCVGYVMYAGYEDFPAPEAF